jgi:hypothetical protein
VARLRALAAGLPNAAYAERVIEAPFDAVWAVFGDLEGGVPRFEWSVRSLAITRRDGEALELESSGVLGRRRKSRAIWRPGWCVMSDHAGIGQIGMAAAPEGERRTRVAHFGQPSVRTFCVRSAAAGGEISRGSRLCEPR